ncbi:hypothetical protein SORBI_3005G161200 [Sorghum bicolor]|uniref:Terpene synthase N-terminal domain-containing protein n=2 Tax=Sorghum bicolor TaxID=4558 RepID=A0A1B6PSV2_SORBI|nr:hypothetical protein SORBI_3005G161200 [Sorghum bicolor]
MQALAAAAASPPFVALLSSRRWVARKRHQPLAAAGRAPRQQHGNQLLYNEQNARHYTDASSHDVRGGRQKDEPRDLPGMIDAIKGTLKIIDEVKVSVSAYDTAWVALVKNQAEGGDGPQFPSSIDWIAQNQLADGSWGDKTFFLIHDRIINTLACIIALKSWNVHDDKYNKGRSFICENLWRLNEDDEDWMLVGFEITLLTLLEKAKDLGHDLPYDEPALQAIYAKRDLKLAKIPKDILYAVPTTLLLSIEGMPSLDWKRLLRLQCADGSFMSSPAPTAYALMETGDEKCLEFLDRVVKKFNGGVPFTYPLDIFERLWVVDRLERLGISRYFTGEIQECLDYVHRQWTREGLGSTRDFVLSDIDDTAMGLRLLRLHGYHVNPCVLEHFKKDGEFVCYPMQSKQSVTAMYNLYRASQVAFPGEKILEQASAYCRSFLDERRASGRLDQDKWVIAKDLPGEVGYSLDFPWTASLPRVETRTYLEQYGGSHDVWIGKVLYRMPLFSNDVFLEAAKQDFRNFQRLCKLEWHALAKWYHSSNLESYGVARGSALRAYFLAAANVFEPSQADERLAWARTAMLADAVSGYLLQCDACTATESRREGLISRLERNGDQVEGPMTETDKVLLRAIRELIDLDASHGLREVWVQWLRSWSHDPVAVGGNTALLLVRAMECCSGRYISVADRNVNHLDEYSQLEQLTHSICCKLTSRVLAQNGEDNNKEAADSSLDQQAVELEMQELARCVLQSCKSIDRAARQAFLHVAKTYYYVAHCSNETIDTHISKVIFEDVV